MFVLFTLKCVLLGARSQSLAIAKITLKNGITTFCKCFLAIIAMSACCLAFSLLFEVAVLVSKTSNPPSQRWGIAREEA